MTRAEKDTARKRGSKRGEDQMRAGVGPEDKGGLVTDKSAHGRRPLPLNDDQDNGKLLMPTTCSALRIATLSLGLLIGTSALAHAEGGSSQARMETWKTPSCGCCAMWVEIAEEAGYDVSVTDTRNYTAMKKMANVPQPLWSCHTTRIGGYTVEGHVPLAAVEKLLSEQPEIAGIAVPGMPAGSPGMGNDPEARFDVMAFGGTAGDNNVFYKAGSAAEDAGDEGGSGWFSSLFGSAG